MNKTIHVPHAKANKRQPCEKSRAMRNPEMSAQTNDATGTSGFIFRKLCATASRRLHGRGMDKGFVD
ncbi:MAG: hypothetical protein EBV06_14465, partial [Planctomycetia bacterium]|nr:hypothetical protein [Planctomycetia bacterium]